MEGYLLKQSPAGLKPWQKRYFLLSGGDLLYFKAPPSASTESKGAIALLSAKVRQVDEKAFDILDSGGRVWNLKALNAVEGSRWLQALAAASSAAARAAAPTAPLLSLIHI